MKKVLICCIILAMVLSGCGASYDVIASFDTRDPGKESADNGNSDTTSYVKDGERDLNNLRHNANYEIEVYPGVYWVPTVSLGESSYTNEEIKAMLTDTPEKKREKIDTVYEALQLYQIGQFYQFDYSEFMEEAHYYDGEIWWEQHSTGDHAVRTNGGACADSSAWLNYMVKEDYEEVGFYQLSEIMGGGHATNYIKQGEWYYYIDLTQYKTDYLTAPTESGYFDDYNRCPFGTLLKTKDPAKIVEYYNDFISRFDNPKYVLAFIYKGEEGAWDIASLFETENGVDVACHLMFGMRGISDVQLLYDDPEDVLTYEFVEGPQETVDWSSLPTYDFVNMKQGEVQKTQDQKDPSIEEKSSDDFEIKEGTSDSELLDANEEKENDPGHQELENIPEPEEPVKPSVPQNITGTLEPTKGNGEYHWEINVAVTNETGSNLKLKEYSTVFYQGNSTIRDRLESGDGRNMHDVMDLSPGETENWIYQDSVQEDFDYVIYRLIYLDDQGKEVNYQYTFKMTNSTE